MRTKASKKSTQDWSRRSTENKKLRSYYDAGISAEVIRKDIRALIPWTIYNHYKLFNEKMANPRRKEVEESLILQKILAWNLNT